MIAALVPAKALSLAKERLASVLSGDERRRLALAMLEDVLAVLAATRGLSLRAVVSPDADVMALAQRLGALALAEPPGCRGVNQALSYAVGELSPHGTDALLVVPLDVPSITPAEIEGILEALPQGRGIVLCPSKARGTSALALRPPDAIPFRFGRNSFVAHRREAIARSIPTRVLRIPSLVSDIDGPEDLLSLLEHPPDPKIGLDQSATHRLLAEIGLAERLGSAPVRQGT